MIFIKIEKLDIRGFDKIKQPGIKAVSPNPKV